MARIPLLSAAAIAVIVVVAANAPPAHSDERPVRLGPVGPEEPILTTAGNKNVIAFYVPDDGYCNLYVVLNERTDESGASAVQIRVSLSARQIAHIDTAQNESLNLQCGDNIDTLAIVP
jgi:hypothetical protein